MVTEESLEQQQCEVHTDVRVTIVALDYEYNTRRERNRRASPQPGYS